MSAQLSRWVAVYSRHFVASRINAPAVVFTLDHFVTTQRTIGWTKSLRDPGPFRNNPENNRVDQIVTRPKTLLYYSFVLFLTSAFLLRGRYRRTDRPRRNGNNTPHLVLHIATWPNLLPTWLGSRVVSVLDSGVVGPGFKSQPRRRQVTVLGKLFTSIVLLFT